MGIFVAPWGLIIQDRICDITKDMAIAEKLHYNILKADAVQKLILVILNSNFVELK